MKNSYKIILGLLALAGVYSLVLVSLMPTKANSTPSSGLLGSLGIGSSKTDKNIETELSSLKTDYDSALNKINALESKVTTSSGVTLNNFRFTETALSGEPNKLIIQAKNGSVWEDAQVIESKEVNA